MLGSGWRVAPWEFLPVEAEEEKDAPQAQSCQEERTTAKAGRMNTLSSMGPKDEDPGEFQESTKQRLVDDRFWTTDAHKRPCFKNFHISTSHFATWFRLVSSSSCSDK